MKTKTLRQLLVVLAIAGLCFGGSFTCHTHFGDDSPPPTTR